MNRIILIGAITKAHGLRGAMQVICFNVDSRLWSKGQSLLLVERARATDNKNQIRDFVDVDALDQLRETDISSIKTRVKDRLILSLDGIARREDVDELKGMLLGVPANELGPLETGEFWHHEVVGWKVVSDTGEEFGEITNVMTTNVDLLEVRPITGGTTFFVPMVDSIVKELDRDNRRFVIDPLEGLIP